MEKCTEYQYYRAIGTTHHDRTDLICRQYDLADEATRRELELGFPEVFVERLCSLEAEEGHGAVAPVIPLPPVGWEGESLAF